MEWSTPVRLMTLRIVASSEGYPCLLQNFHRANHIFPRSESVGLDDCPDIQICLEYEYNACWYSLTFPLCLTLIYCSESEVR